MLRLTVLGGDGAEAIHPSSVRPEGPARPHGTVPAAPGELCATTTPLAHAPGTSSQGRSCLSPWERRTREPAHTIEVVRGQCPTTLLSRQRATTAMRGGY